MHYQYGLTLMREDLIAMVCSREALHVKLHKLTTNLLLLEKHCLPKKVQADYQTVIDFFERTGPLDPYLKEQLATKKEYRQIAELVCGITFALFEQKASVDR